MQPSDNTAFTMLAPALVEAMSDAVLVLDNKWRIIYANRACGVLLQKSVDTLIGIEIQTIVDIRTADVFPQTITDMRTMGTWKGEGSVSYSNSKRSIVSITLTSLHSDDAYSDSSSDRGTVLCVMSNISEQQHIESDHRRIKNEYRDIARYYHVLLNSKEHFLVRTDFEGRFLFCNHAYLNFFGYSEELIGNGFDVVIHPDSMQEAYNHFSRVMEHPNEMIPCEMKQVTKQKDIVYVQWESSVVFDDDGKPLCVQSIGYDITPRKLHEHVLGEYNHLLAQRLQEQEQSLQEQQEAYRLIAENMSDAIIVRDLATSEMLFVSSSIEQILGYTPEQYQAVDFALIAATDEDLWIMRGQYEQLRDIAFRRISMNDEAIVPESSVRIKARKKDGTVIWLESRRQMVQRAHSMYAMMTILRDISRRVAVEEVAKQNEEKYRTLMEYAGDAIFIIDPTTSIILEANRQAEILTGRVRYELIGMHQSLLYPRTEGLNRFTEDKAHEQGYSRDIARRRVGILKSDGTTVPVEIMMNTIELYGKTVLHGLYRDVSPQVQAENDIREALHAEKLANTLKSNFTTMVSHQFRTPLTIIKANVGILEELVNKYNSGITFSPDMARNGLQRIHTEIERIISMMNDVMSLGRIESGKVLFQTEVTDIQAFLHDYVTYYHKDVATHQAIEFSVTYAEGVAMYPIDLDRVLFREAIANIISNAFKYSTGKRNPTMNLHFEADYVLIAVRDYGVGIPLEDQDKIFQSFSRAQNVLHIQGTGLGLVIAKQFIELHGGEISFQSEVRKGTTFTIMLPRKRQKNASILFENGQS